MTQTLKLTPENLTKLSQYESSIAHWSNEHTVLLLKARKMLDGIDALYSSRQKVIDELLSESGIDAKTVSNVNITPNGDVHVELQEVPTAQ